MRSNWPNLPPELLFSIAEKTSTIAEYGTLRDVCKPWQRTLIPYPRHLPLHSPWLMLPRNRKRPATLSFYDLKQRYIIRFELPYITGKGICGTSRGWIILEHDHRLSLLNPLTRNSIELPSFGAPPFISGDKWCIIKASLSCNPSEPGCFVVAWFQSADCVLGFCQIGDVHWTELKMRDVGRNVPHILDFTCQNHLVYTLNNKKQVTVFDLQNHSERIYPHTLNFSFSFDLVYLVEGDEESGGPLVIKFSGPNENKKASVYKWFEDWKPKWRIVKDIGKRVVFLHRSSPVYTSASANLLLESWQGNQICYDIRRSTTIDIDMVNLDSGRDVQSCARSIGLFDEYAGSTRWFTPRLV